MAMIQIDLDELKPLVEQIAMATIAALDVPAIARIAAMEAAKANTIVKKPIYTCRETAEIIGISTKQLKSRRQSGAIKGKALKGHKGCVYTLEEIERYIGRKIA